MKTNINLKLLLCFLTILFYSCSKQNDDFTDGGLMDTDHSIQFSVQWEKEIRSSGFDAIFFNEYFVLPNNSDIDVYSKNTGEHIVHISENLIPDISWLNLKIENDLLYVYSHEEKKLYQYNLISHELLASDYIGYILEFNVIDEHIYYVNYDALVRTDFELSFRDTLYTLRNSVEDSFNHFIQMAVHSNKNNGRKYLALAYREQKYHADKTFINVAFDLRFNEPTLTNIFHTNDNVYNLKIEGDQMRLSSSEISYIYDFSDKSYYLVNSNQSLNILREVYYLETSESHQNRSVAYYDLLDFNCYNYEDGDLLWTINNRYIEDVSNLNLSNDYYFCLLKENELNLVNSNTGKINAFFDYKENGERKLFRECSNVFNNNEVILRQGNDKIIKLKISKTE